MPLGLMPGMSYEEKEIVLAPGDSVLLHSDGIVEAHDPDRDMFGFPRLMQTVADSPSGQALIDRVLRDLDEFTGPGAEQEDDITMVTLERSPERRLLAEFELPSAAGNEREAIDRVASAISGVGLEPARLDRLKTAVGEATMNAMEHGNEYDAGLPVAIRVLQDADAVRVQVTDHGDAGEPAVPEVPDIEAKLDGRQSPRGWGLFLIKEMVDETVVTTDGRAAHARARPTSGRRPG